MGEAQRSLVPPPSLTRNALDTDVGQRVVQHPVGPCSSGQLPISQARGCPPLPRSWAVCLLLLTSSIPLCPERPAVSLPFFT